MSEMLKPCPFHKDGIPTYLKSQYGHFIAVRKPLSEENRYGDEEYYRLAYRRTKEEAFSEWNTRSHDESMVWQPIETAPKDGTEILVYKDVASVPVVHIAFYRNQKEWEESGKIDNEGHHICEDCVKVCVEILKIEGRYD